MPLSAQNQSHIFCLLFCRKRISFTKSINGCHVQTSLSLTIDGMHRHRNQTQWNWSVPLVINIETLHKTEHFKQSPLMSPSKCNPPSVAIWQPTLLVLPPRESNHISVELINFFVSLRTNNSLGLPT